MDDKVRPNIGMRIRQLRELKAKIAEINARYEEELQPYKDVEKKLRAILLDFLTASGAQNFKSPEGLIYQSDRTTFSIEDLVAFQRHVIGSEAWELLDWKANSTATKDYIEANKAPPPGVRPNPMTVLGLRAPTKKRPPTVKTDTATFEVDEEAE